MSYRLGSKVDRCSKEITKPMDRGVVTPSNTFYLLRWKIIPLIILFSVCNIIRYFTKAVIFGLGCKIGISKNSQSLDRTPDQFNPNRWAGLLPSTSTEQPRVRTTAPRGPFLQNQGERVGGQQTGHPIQFYSQTKTEAWGSLKFLTHSVTWLWPVPLSLHSKATLNLHHLSQFLPACLFLCLMPMYFCFQKKEKGQVQLPVFSCPSVREKSCPLSSAVPTDKKPKGLLTCALWDGATVGCNLLLQTLSSLGPRDILLLFYFWQVHLGSSFQL